MTSVFLAYRSGVFPDIPEGMDKEEFARFAVQRIMHWSDAVILEVGKPVGLVAVQLWLDHGIVRVFWFPWATLRNKIETMLQFILDYRKVVHLIGYTNEKRFMTHLYRFGVVRAIGNSHGFEATLYESVK